MNKVIKRDGREVPFRKNKITTAILKAFIAIDGEISDYAMLKAEKIADFIAKKNEEKELNVEEIQDLVERGLMSTKRKDVARAYIAYRDKRARKRKWNSKMMDLVTIKLNASDVKNQNANVDEYSFGGRRGEADSVIFKQYALDNLMSEMARSNHLNNEIYIHDLDSYALGMHNCLTIPFDKLLAEGFNTRQTDIRPANSVNTAFQLVAVLFQLQSLQQFGGVSASHLDWTMVPYVRKSFLKHYLDGLKYISQKTKMTIPAGIGDRTFKLEDLPKEIISKTSIDDKYMYDDEKAYQYAYDMTVKETQQAVEGMYHNLNTLQSRSGN